MLLIATVVFNASGQLSLVAHPVWLAQQSETPPETEQPAKTTTNIETGDQQAKSDQDTDEQKSTASSQDAAGPYDMEAIKAFNRALYGS